MDEPLLPDPSWEYSSNYDQAIFGVQKASLNKFWDYSPSSANIASDWLQAKCSPVDEKERKWITVSILHSLRKELTYLLRHSLVSEIQNNIVVS